jgi:aminomethyltransferase
MELKKVALNDIHEALGAKMVPFAGFNMPVRYSSDIEEHQTVRQGVGIFDVSHMGEFLVNGPKALELIQLISTNDASKLENGQAQYSCMTNDEGGIVDDLLVYKFADEKYMLVVNAGNIDKDWAWVNFKNEGIGAELRNVSDNYSLFAVQGPKALEVLQKLTEVNLSDIPFYTFKVGSMAGIQHLIISATGYTGSGGFELYVANADAVKLWNAVMDVGQEAGIKPIGLGARDTLRLEMGYCLYGNDITDSTSPLEAGLGWITKIQKGFNASDKVATLKESGVKRKLVGFIMEERGIPRAHYPIVNAQGEPIGEVTSGTMSPSMNVGLGLAYVSTPYAQPGTEIFVQVRNKNLKAKIQKLPLYKK